MRKTLTEHWIIDFKKQNPDTIFNYVELWHIPMIDPQFCAQGYCETFKNHPKKFLIIISQSCPHKTLPEQIFHIQQPSLSMLFWYVPIATKDPSCPAQGLSCPVRQSQKENWFPKSYPQSRLSEQILHIRPPNSSMLCLGMLQRKIHSVLLKEYHELFKNRPKKIWFSKSCPHTVLSEQILHMQPPKSSMLCFDMFQRKVYSVLFMVYQEFFESPKEILISQSCPHIWLSEQILHVQPPKSSMLCFNMFQQKIYSILLKVYHELFENHPKKFWFPKSCLQSRLSKKIH